jgi:hypothetical protein
VAELDGGLGFLHEAAHERVVNRELRADLLHDQALFEADRSA